jgi:hypothetical protein
MDIGVVKWDILSINTYSQIRQDVYIFSQKRQMCNQMKHWAKLDMYDHKFWKRKYYI